MSKPNTFENDLLNLLFKNIDIAGIGDAGGLRGSVAAGSLYCSLHSAYPGEAGDQSSSELAYTGYARQAVARGAGWTVTGNVVNPAANIDFPECTANPATALFWGVGSASSGAGKLLYIAAIGGGAYECTGKADDTVLIPGLTLAVDDRVVFWAAGESVLPAGITQGTVYWVKTAPGGNVYTLSATQGGVTLDITADGAAMAQKVTPLQVNVGTIPRIKNTSAIKEE